MADTLQQLAAAIGAALQARGYQLATAESCTGGGVAQALTAIAGSSVWFERGFVTYSNASKQEMLDVPSTTLEARGAVSEETACAMAKGALRHAHATCSLAITGIAGPGGGSNEKPVGMVCFAWALPRGCQLAVSAETMHFGGDREAVRHQAMAHAMQGLLQRLG